MKAGWSDVTEEQFMDALEALPPAVMGGGGFMLGEPSDLSPEGKTRFWGYLKRNGRFLKSSRPMTIAEFREVCPGAADYAYSERSA